MYIYIYIARAPARSLDTPLSGPLLRLLCHHAHMLANLSVSREQRAGELPQIIRGGGLSLGSHENKGSWGEPHESVFAQHPYKETI